VAGRGGLAGAAKEENVIEAVKRLWGGAKKFLPHEFKNTVEFVAGTPRVFLTRDAYEDMFILVDECCSKEVGWVGTVDRVGRDYLIREVFLVAQEVHATTCEITPDGLAEFAAEILPLRGIEVANAIRFWGHSHVNMGTSPSGQDDAQLRELAASCGDFFVRGILNKSGRMEFAIVLHDLGVVVRDVTWELWEPADEQRRARWQAEIAAKVREIKPVPLAAGFGGSGVRVDLASVVDRRRWREEDYGD
jgi:hypothetical protein